MVCLTLWTSCLGCDAIALVSSVYFTCILSLIFELCTTRVDENSFLFHICSTTTVNAKRNNDCISTFASLPSLRKIWTASEEMLGKPSSRRR